MPVFYITLRDIHTNREAESMVTRQSSEQEARLYAEQAIQDAGKGDSLIVTTIRQRKES